MLDCQSRMQKNRGHRAKFAKPLCMPLTFVELGELLAEFTGPASVVSHSWEALTHILQHSVKKLTGWVFVISLCMFTSSPVFPFFEDLSVSIVETFLEPNYCWPACWIGLSCPQCSSQRLGPGRSFLPRTRRSSWVRALRQSWTVHRTSPHISPWVIKCYTAPAC